MPFRPQVGPVGVTVAPDGTQLLFWQGPGNDHLLEGWYSAGDWNGPADLTIGQFGGNSPIYSAPAVTATPDGTQQLVFTGLLGSTNPNPNAQFNAQFNAVQSDASGPQVQQQQCE